MQPSRISELLEPFLGSSDDQRLTAGILMSISTYIDILKRWNARINLTAIRDDEEIVTRHFGESFFAARHLFPWGNHPGTVAVARPAERSSATRVADLGSGAGFPGIPIKLWNSAISLTLIESNQKKAMFLREVTRALALANVKIENVRAETVAPSSFDIVTMRAVERCGAVVPLAANLLAPAGRLTVLIGSSQLAAVRSGAQHLAWDAPIALPESQSRYLLVGHSS